MNHMIPAGEFCLDKTTYCQFVQGEECVLYHIDIPYGGVDPFGFPNHHRAFPCKNQWPDGAKLIKEGKHVT